MGRGGGTRGTNASPRSQVSCLFLRTAGRLHAPLIRTPIRASPSSPAGSCSRRPSDCCFVQNALVRSDRSGLSSACEHQGRPTATAERATCALAIARPHRRPGPDGSDWCEAATTATSTLPSRAAATGQTGPRDRARCRDCSQREGVVRLVASDGPEREDWPSGVRSRDDCFDLGGQATARHRIGDHPQPRPELVLAATASSR